MGDGQTDKMCAVGNIRMLFDAGMAGRDLLCGSEIDRELILIIVPVSRRLLTEPEFETCVGQQVRGSPNETCW